MRLLYVYFDAKQQKTIKKIDLIQYLLSRSHFSFVSTYWSAFQQWEQVLEMSESNHLPSLWIVLILGKFYFN